MTQVYSINTPQVGELTGTRLADSYLELVESQPGGLGVLPLPHLDAGPFLSYGIQWIAFGIVAPIGLGYFVYSEIQHAPTGRQTGAADGRTRHRRAEARRPLRPQALTQAIARAAAAVCTNRDSVTARRRSATCGGGPSPRLGRISSPCG